MLANIGLYSYGAAATAYGLLAIFIFATRRNHKLALPFLAASTLTVVWASIVAGSTLLEYPLVKTIQVTEALRNAGWNFLLLRLLGEHFRNSSHFLATKRWIPWFVACYTLVILVLSMAPSASRALALPLEFATSLAFALSLAMAVFGMLLLEQLYRNSNIDARWSVKFVCIGLGCMFVYDFCMYAEALLFRQLDANLWQARGLVVATTAPLLAVGVSRANRDSNLQFSRPVVFHSITLLAAGVYLILMAAAGYVIRFVGGDWSSVLQIAFLCAAALLLLALLFSGQLRAKTQVWLSKNFFSYKYDYRNEWLQFTRTLAEDGQDIPHSIIRAFAQIHQSPFGLLWSRGENGQFQFESGWQIEQPEGNTSLGTLPQWLEQTEWVIDMKEWQRDPAAYGDLQLPPVIHSITRPGLIIPLMFGETIQGILVLRESDIQAELNWEDRDLLKVAGRQAASHLAQFQANRDLIQARQFEAFNRLSAYVIHDLKNILAQQSLIISNASRHRHNPEFIDDVINTVENSVERMSRLMQQMRDGERVKTARPEPLLRLLEEAVTSRRSNTPYPTLENHAGDPSVRVDREQLVNVFSHLIQNAQEATGGEGKVNVRLLRQNGDAVVEIQDNGVGMDAEFVRERLFKPFDSTKGLTGMGIGAFESRELVRSIGGDIQVESTPGVGSLFRVVLPCSAEHDISDNSLDEKQLVKGQTG